MFARARNRNQSFLGRSTLGRRLSNGTYLASQCRLESQGQCLRIVFEIRVVVMQKTATIVWEIARTINRRVFAERVLPLRPFTIKSFS